MRRRENETLRPQNSLRSLFLLIAFLSGLNQLNTYAYFDDDHSDIDRTGFEQLQEINPDVFGWIHIFGTNINYPLVQGTDNFHYLTTNAHGEPAIAGAIFMDFRNSNTFEDFNTIIYGHDMTRDVMFGEIGNFQHADYFNERAYGLIYTGERMYGVEFFAFMLVDAYDFEFYNPQMNDEDDKQAHLDRMMIDAIQLREIDVTTEDRLIMLSTCTPTVTNGRHVLVGRLTDYPVADPFDGRTYHPTGLDNLWLGLFGRTFSLLDGIAFVVIIILFSVVVTLFATKLVKKRKDHLEDVEKSIESASPEQGAPKKKRKPSTLVGEFIFISIKVGGMMVIILLLFTFAFGVWQVDDFSMTPALEEGDLVFFNRLDRDFVASDMIIVQFEGQRQVRRIVAVEGDTVDITYDGLVINGRLHHEFEIHEETTQFVEGISFPLIIPEGEVFILGDSRQRAVDSRIYGNVRVEDVLGSVIATVRRRNL